MVNRKDKNYFSLTLFLCLSANFIFADGGTHSGNVLIQSLSAKAQGMGETYTALSVPQGDVTAFQYNPASLGFIQKREGSATYKGGSFGDSLGVFAYGSPLTIQQGRRRVGSYAATFLYYSFGNLEYVDGAGVKKTSSAQKDFSFIFSYSNLLWPNISVGLNGKILNSELAETYKATAFAADVGTLLNLGHTLSLGFSLLNVGTGLKYDERKEELPLTFRMGLASDWKWSQRHKTLVGLDVVKRREEPIRNNIGGEYLYDDGSVAMALRMGYRFGEDAGKLNFGLGIPYKQYRFDYSAQIMGGIGFSHFFTLGYFF